MLIGFLFSLFTFVAADPIRNPILNSANGSIASEGQFPWQLILTSTASIHDCAAVLIEPNVALTGAHCMESLLPTYHVTGGQHNRDVASGNEVTLGIESFTSHPDFDLSASGFPNDIAVLKLSGSFDTTEPFIKTIPMASSNSSDFAGSVCTLSGWGWIDLTKPRPSTLTYTDVDCIPNSDCAEKWTGVAGSAINDGHMCVFEEGKTTCQGDGGGPLVCDGVLAGTTSWRLSPCSNLFPTVYTRISYFRDWIDSNK